jgi:DNA-binding phage protein
VEMTVKSFDEVLFKQLRNPDFARAYLEDALNDSIDEFLVALRKYVQANDIGSSTAAEAMYRTLLEDRNPGIRQVEAILQTHGLQLHVA